MKLNKLTAKGFTLVEMLVVVLIISIISTIGANTYKNQREQIIFNDSVAHVLQMMKTARNYAVTSRPYWDGTDNVVPPGGYGVYFERNADVEVASRVILFANSTNDNKYDLDIDEEVFSIPLSVELYAVDDDQNSPPLNLNKFVVIFKPSMAEAIEVGLFEGNNAIPTAYNDLYFMFRKLENTTPGTTIHINRISGFPEVL